MRSSPAIIKNVSAKSGYGANYSLEIILMNYPFLMKKMIATLSYLFDNKEREKENLSQGIIQKIIKTS